MDKSFRGIDGYRTVIKSSKVYIAGHEGLLGSALVRVFGEKGFRNIITKRRRELDLRDQARTQEFFKKTKPEYVILCAAKVGGIGANIKYPAQFIYDNIAIGANVIDSSYKYNVKRLIFFGSSCCYPKDAEQPYKEDSLFTGEVEPTSRPYAIAKLAGIEMCLSYNKEYGTRFLVLLPATLYGPEDNFDPEEGHVLASLIGKFLGAKRDGKKTVELWGTGEPRREFLYVDDMAEAVFFFLNLEDERIDWQFPVINIGWGLDISIAELERLISNEVGYPGNIIWNTTKPNGALRKTFDVEQMRHYGFHPRVTLDDGLRKILSCL